MRPTTSAPIVGPRVAAAIDFGTYGTGYAWVAIEGDGSIPRSARHIFDREDWPQTPEMRYPKTLTALLLDRRGEVVEWGFPARNRQGSQQGARYVEGMKMSLRPRDNDPSASPSPHGMADDLADPVPLIAAYLNRIREAALAEITRYHYRPEDVRWCMTVPAIWSPAALAAMREAARSAGFAADHDSLLLLPEPDAAALACHIERETPPGTPFATVATVFRRQGRRFVVADCGGGTIDVGSYQVTADGTLDQLRTPEGDKLGAQYTSMRFLDLLAERLGGESELLLLTEERAADLLRLVQAWEQARNAFKGESPDETVNIDLDSLYHRLSDAQRRSLRRSQDGVDDMIIIRRRQITAILDTSIDPLLRFIDHHLAAARDRRRWRAEKPLLYLVGGFSRSPYLQRRVERHVRRRAVLVRPDRPERAVLYGAVHHCYAPGISLRRADATYGLRVAEPYDPQDGDRLWRNSEGQAYCDQRFLKFVGMDEPLPVGTLRTKEKLVPAEPTDSEIVLDFCRTPLPNPRYYNEQPSRVIGRLRVNLHDCMHLPVYEREMDVHVTFGEPEIRAEAVVRHTGEAVETTLDFTGEY